MPLGAQQVDEPGGDVGPPDAQPAASRASASRPGPLPISSTRAPGSRVAANRSSTRRTESGIVLVPSAYAAALAEYAATVIDRASRPTSWRWWTTSCRW